VIELAVRLVLSLALVVGLLVLVVRIGQRRLRGGNDAAVRVLHRQALTRSSGVAVLAVGGRVILVGTTDHQVSLLTELEPDAFAADLTSPEPAVAPAAELDQEPAAEPVAGPAREPRTFAAHLDTAVTELDPPRHHDTTAGSPLSGSVLSGDTWRQAAAAVRGRR